MNSQDSVPKAVPIPKKSGSQASFTSGTASEPASSEAPVTLVNERQSLLSLSKRTDAERTNSLPSAAAKDKSKKKFSFGSLVQQSAQKPKNPETNSVTKSDEKLDVLESVNDDSSVKVSWISEIANDESLPKFRSFALRFFVQLAEQFPPDKVNIYGFARSLEKAVYERCNGTETNDAWKSSYWDKVHALVAAIAGKNKKGTLFHLILDGSFQSPDELAKLSDDVLEESFEERAVNI